MKLIKVIFKDLSDSQILELINKLKELDFENDLEVFDLKDGWKDDPTAMELYKAQKKANEIWKEYLLNKTN